MLPTFNLTGNLVLAERLSTRLGQAGKGDVVLIRSPREPRKVVIKRIVGMEGDTVSYVNSDSKNADGKEATIVVKIIISIC